MATSKVTTCFHAITAAEFDRIDTVAQTIANNEKRQVRNSDYVCLLYTSPSPRD